MGGVNSFSLLRGSVMYVTVHQEFDAAMDGGGSDQFFNGFRDGMLKASKNSRIVSEKSISLHEFPGREIRHTDATGFLYKTRAYLVGHRIYAISAVTPTEKQSESVKEVEKFLDSFELVGQPPKEAPVKPA